MSPSGDEGWIPFTSHNRDDVPSQSGVYEIGVPDPVSRLLGPDAEGRLIIGKSDDLHSRIGDLRRAAFEGAGEDTHSAGHRSWELGLAEKLDLQEASLKFRFNILRDPKDEEEDRLAGYAEEFGELPPLNRSG